jgi:ADP-ribosyl-[dinitrogen reductase] hydrolase
MERIERYLGSMLGLAVGDALGTRVEFQAPGTFAPIDLMEGGGPFNLAPGQWTDDTSMALCLAESLIEKGEFDPLDQMERYLRWWHDGYLSSTGKAFDIGHIILQALQRFERSHEPYAGSIHVQSAGNGSLMRLAPVAMAYARQPREAVRLAALSSQTTHGAEEAVDSCRYFAGLLVGALQGESMERLLADHYAPVSGLWQENPLSPTIAEVASGSFNVGEPPTIRATGYVVKTLEAALWAFQRGTTFQQAVLLAVNLGDDADTVGAICGQLAGAFYGEKAIPRLWLEPLAMREKIVEYARKLYRLAESMSVGTTPATGA